jgi:hypothetical protein
VPGSLDRPDKRPTPEPPDANDVPGRLRSAAPRPDLPAVADRVETVDQLATGDRPERWSRADLGRRLERLPPGHPSSLRSDGPDTSELTRPGPDSTPTSGLDDRDRPADAVKRSYWDEVPRFFRAWTDHLRRWPRELATAIVDRSRDPAGSWRGDGNQYLDPERHAQSNDLIAGVRRTERKLTEHLKEAELDNTSGGWLEGLEHRLKGDERLKEKLAGSLKITPDKAPEDVMQGIADAIRYTFCFVPDNYAAGYSDVSQRLESTGYRMVYSRNHWRDDLEYKGINTRWVTQEGQLFEVQFHTPESYHAKQEVTHSSYERARNQLTGRSERREIEAFQCEVCSWIAVPAEVTSIPDYKERD